MNLRPKFEVGFTVFPGAVLLAVLVLLLAATLVAVAFFWSLDVAAAVAMMALASWYVTHWIQSGWAGAAQIPLAAVFWIAVLGLLVPGLAGVINGLDYVFWAMQSPNGGTAVGFTLLGIAIACGATWLIYGIPRAWSDRRFLVLAACLIVCARLLFLFVVWMEPTDDFARMWRMAGHLAKDGFHVPTMTDRGLERIRFERSLLYLYNLFLIFGDTLWSFKIGNTLLSLLSSLIAFSLTRSWFGSQAARGAFLASFLALETVMASGIPSHDVPGALLTLLAIALFADVARKTTMRPLSAVGIGIVLGLVLEALDLQRTNAIIVIVSMMPVGLATSATVAARTVSRGFSWSQFCLSFILLLAIPIGTYSLCEFGLQKAGILRPAEQHSERRMKKIAAYTDSWGSGHSNHWKAEWTTRKLTRDDWTTFALRKGLTDLYLNPLDRVSLYLRKVDRLFRMGSQTYFYVRGAELPNGGVVRGQRELMVKMLAAGYSALFLLLMICGIWFWFGNRAHLGVECLPILYLSFLSVGLLLLFETQPRYIYPIWYLGSIYVGYFLSIFVPPGKCHSNSDVVTRD